MGLIIGIIVLVVILKAIAASLDMVTGVIHARNNALPAKKELK